MATRATKTTTRATTKNARADLLAARAFRKDSKTDDDDGRVARRAVPRRGRAGRAPRGRRGERERTLARRSRAAV
jgi:hypothetical protein